MWPFKTKEGSKPSFLLSTLAEVLGVLAFISGTSQAASGVSAGNAGVLGVLILLGALAYRSLKRTRLGLKRPSAIRRASEILALLVIAALVLFQNDLGQRIYQDPLFAVVPIWIFAAYLVIFVKRPYAVPEASRP